MELPVVATAVGGNPIVLEEGVSGFLVPYPDSAALARRVVELLASSTLCRSLGRRARQGVLQRYSAAAMVRDIEALYDRVIERRSRGEGNVDWEE